MTQRLEYVLVQSIKDLDRERKDYGNLEDFAQKIKAKGIIQPLLLDGEYVLIAGGRRLAAAKLAGLTTVPAIIRPGISPQERKELELVENLDRKDFTWQELTLAVAKLHAFYKRTEEGASIRATAERLGMSKSIVGNYVKLAQRIEEIPELLECKTANDAWKALDKLDEALILQELETRRLAKAEKSSVEKAEVADLIARSKAFLAEVKAEKDAQAGTESDSDVASTESIETPLVDSNSNYLTADVFDVMSLMEDEALGVGSIIECDPPYGIDLTKVKKSGETDDYNEIDQNQYIGFLEKLANEFYRIQGDQSTVIFWYAHQWYEQVYAALEDAGYYVNAVPAIWLKLNSSGQSLQPNHLLASNYEPFFLARKGTSVPLAKPGSSNVFMEGVVKPKKKIHPTERPVVLIRDIIKTVSIITPSTKGFVPFLGSGNTLVAMEDLGIDAFGCDLSKIYKQRFEARKEGVDI